MNKSNCHTKREKKEGIRAGDVHTKIEQEKQLIDAIVIGRENSDHSSEYKSFY